MKKLKTVFALMFIAVMAIGMISCEKDEPNFESGHDYYSALVYDGDQEYYWVIDMDNTPKGAADGSFIIQAWTLDGKKISEKNTYSGRYSYDNQNIGTRIYIGWNHQSMNTMWEFTEYGIKMIASANPEELSDYKYYAGVPDFKGK